MEALRRKYAHVRNPSSTSAGAYLVSWVADGFAGGRLRESTARGYFSNMSMVAAWFGNLRLDRLTAADLDDLYRHLLSTGGRDGAGRAASTVNQVHRIVKTALGDAAKKGLIDRNEALYADPPKLVRTPLDMDSLWEPHEVIAFLDSPWLPENRRILYTVAFATGFRCGELAGLYWSDLDGATLTVRRARANGFKGRPYEGLPKSAAAMRTVEMHAFVAEKLRQWQATQAGQMLDAGFGPQYVFTNARLGPFNPNGMSKNWTTDSRRAVQEGTVSKYANLHRVRHWYGTNLFAVGTDLPTARGLMGHQSATFTVDTYGHGDRIRSKEASQRVGGLLWEK
jgi:integrase